MRYYFFDASALVKLYALEPGSTQVRNLVRSASATPPTAALFVCDISLPETLAAIVRRQRTGDITKSEAQRLLARARADLDPEEPKAPFAILASSDVIRPAADLVAAHELRGADAIQLAAALAALANLGPSQDAEFDFVADDQQLLTAAGAAGVNTLDPK